MKSETLYNLINQYRADNGIQAIIPRSPSLDYVAQTHVQDLDSLLLRLGSNCAGDPNTARSPDRLLDIGRSQESI